MELEQIRQLPQTHHATIPETYRDEMGHMNVAYYMALFNDAAWGVFELFGINRAVIADTTSGVFAVEQHIRYLAEVHIGQTVSIHSRILGRGTKTLHFMHFMINEDTNMLASTFEALGMHIDMQTRRSAPWVTEHEAPLKVLLEKHQQLTWDAPLCGVMGAR